jgi:hypothetical protein
MTVLKLIAMPPGRIVEGEIMDPGIVADAIKHLQTAAALIE